MNENNLQSKLWKAIRKIREIKDSTPLSSLFVNSVREAENIVSQLSSYSPQVNQSLLDRLVLYEKEVFTSRMERLEPIGKNINDYFERVIPIREGDKVVYKTVKEKNLSIYPLFHSYAVDARLSLEHIKKHNPRDKSLLGIDPELIEQLEVYEKKIQDICYEAFLENMKTAVKQRRLGLLNPMFQQAVLSARYNLNILEEQQEADAGYLPESLKTRDFNAALHALSMYEEDLKEGFTQNLYKQPESAKVHEAGAN